jgi:transposase
VVTARAAGRKLREVLRLRFEGKQSTRAIGKSCGLSPSTVQEYLGRFTVAKLGWPLPAELNDDEALTAQLFPQEHHPRPSRAEPDFAQMHLELRRKHVTKLLLWQEYRETHPDGYEYSQYCDRYSRWAATAAVTMRQTHVAGEKLFVDFSGDGLELLEPTTGEVRKVKLFLAVLGASNLTYVEPVFGEDLPTWIGCHVRAFEYLGGVPGAVVPDNLRSGVTQANRYEPVINRTYEEMARHYETAVIPARVRKPRDKAKVEQGVLLASRWILAALRHRRFTALWEVKEAVRPLLEKLNNRVMRKLGKSRREVFEEIERAALRPLPDRPYEYAHWVKARANIDYHVEYDAHYYSVPYHLAQRTLDAPQGERPELWLRATETMVEVWRHSRRIASHARSERKHQHTTSKEHMPRSHREYAEWTPARMLEWAKVVGPATETVVRELMRRRPHPEQGFRSCLGVMSLRRSFPDVRLERACARAVRYRAYSYKSVAAILKNNLDQQEESAEPVQVPLPLHENIRGADYYE